MIANEDVVRALSCASSTLRICLLVAFDRANVRDALEGNARLSELAPRVARCPEETLGRLLGTFWTGVFYDWFRLEGDPADPIIHSTDLFKRLSESVRQHGDKLGPLLTWFCDVPQAVREPGTTTATSLEKARAAVDSIRAVDSELAQLAADALTASAVPPLYLHYWATHTHKHGNLDPVVLSRHVMWSPTHEQALLASGYPDIDKLAQSAYMTHPRCVFLCLAELSYLQPFARLYEAIFGPSPANVNLDCDRWMNVVGSGMLPATIGMKYGRAMITEVFDRRPVGEQPIGIIDIGCGDGRKLEGLVRHILSETRRGKVLAEQPLVVVGADFSPVANEQAQRRLQKAFGDDPRVALLPSFKVDITFPDVIDRDLKGHLQECVALGEERRRTAGLRDFLVFTSAIVQERTVCIKSNADALTFVRRALSDPTIERAVREIVPEKDVPLAEVVAQEARTPFATRAGAGALVPPLAAVADLGAFFERWAPYDGGWGFAFMSEGNWDDRSHGQLLFPTGGAGHEQMRAMLWMSHILSGQLLQGYADWCVGAALGGYRRQEMTFLMRSLRFAKSNELPPVPYERMVEGLAPVS